MKLAITIGAMSAASLLAAGCQTNEAVNDTTSTIAPVATNETKSAETMAVLARLEGDWRLQGEDGSLGEEISRFAVSSGGSVVREVMMVGKPHEMTNLYHMDGNAVVCTHYCAVGNQPRMVATGLEQTELGPSLNFTIDTVSNFTEAHDHYMGGLRLTVVDADTVHQDWTTFNADGGVAGTMQFVLKRDPTN
ncbi:MAG: hypothetical protein AAGF47_07250 [Planctomycetota bacterium]